MKIQQLHTSIAILVITGIILISLMTAQSDFALRLRTSVPEAVVSSVEQPIQCLPPAELAPGTYKLTLQATDEAGNHTTKDIIVNVVAPPPPACSDNIDNDSDGAIDSADSICHSDGNPNNPTSYDPSGNSEGTSQPGVCADNIDNDGDLLVDGGDPDCHTDGNAANAATYNPADSSEESSLACPGDHNLALQKNFSHECGPATQQECEPPADFTFNITESTDLIFDYTVASTHCSSVRLHVSIDGQPVLSSDFLGWPGDPNDRPLQITQVSLGPVTPGAHTINLLAEGQRGGCNAGSLESWGGDITVTTTANQCFAACSDNLDNDQDGAIDSQDSACHRDANPANPASYNPAGTDEGSQQPAACADSQDNDNDGFIDGGDPECHTDGNTTSVATYDPDITSEEQPNICADGQDNDSDNFTDSADSLCHTDGNPNNPASYDPTVNSEGAGSSSQCSDNIDNDGDGLIDGGDINCLVNGTFDPTKDSELPPAPTPRCNDGIDNDQDGAIDDRDSGCHTDSDPDNANSYNAADDDEGSLNPAACADSLDNDGDGLIDGADPRCHTDSDATNTDSYDPSYDSETTGGGTLVIANVSGGGDSPDTSSGSTSNPTSTTASRTYRFEAERGHRLAGRHSRFETVGSRQGALLAQERSFIERSVSVVPGNYWLYLNAKHDIPHPVDVAVYLNNRPWKAIRLDKGDNRYRSHAIGQLKNFRGGKVRFRFLKDKFDGVQPDLDRNLHIDWWGLTPNQSRVPIAAGLSSRRTAGQILLPRLNQIVREELGPQHVNRDIWHFYARRLVLPARDHASIQTELRLRQVMRYWKSINPSIPRGS